MIIESLTALRGFKRKVGHIKHDHRSQAIELVALCRKMTHPSEHSAKAVDWREINCLLGTVQKALDSVIEEKSRTPVQNTPKGTIDSFNRAVKGLQEFSAAHPDLNLGDIKESMESKKAADKAVAKKHFRFQKERGRCKHESPGEKVLADVYIGWKPLTSGHVLVQTEMRDKQRLEEVLVAFIEKGLIRWKDNPHFYLNLPNEYEEGFECVHPCPPGQLFHNISHGQARGKTPQFSILLDRGSRITVNPDGRERAFGNIWKPADIFILKEITGALMAANTVCKKGQKMRLVCSKHVVEHSWEDAVAVSMTKQENVRIIAVPPGIPKQEWRRSSASSDVSGISIPDSAYATTPAGYHSVHAAIEVQSADDHGNERLSGNVRAPHDGQKNASPDEDDTVSVVRGAVSPNRDITAVSIFPIIAAPNVRNISGPSSSATSIRIPLVHRHRETRPLMQQEVRNASRKVNPTIPIVVAPERSIAPPLILAAPDVHDISTPSGVSAKSTGKPDAASVRRAENWPMTNRAVRDTSREVAPVITPNAAPNIHKIKGPTSSAKETKVPDIASIRHHPEPPLPTNQVVRDTSRKVADKGAIKAPADPALTAPLHDITQPSPVSAESIGAPGVASVQHYPEKRFTTNSKAVAINGMLWWRTPKSRHGT